MQNVFPVAVKQTLARALVSFIVLVSQVVPAQAFANTPEGLSLCAHFTGKEGAQAKPTDRSDVTQADFNGVAQKIKTLYTSEMAALGGRLSLSADWNSNSLDARALEIGWVWNVWLYGGLARQPFMTRDAFALVACHEVGHHLGGSPNLLFSPLASEGQADYYATLKCARRFFADEDNLAALKKSGVIKHVVNECRKEFKDQKDQFICMRSSMAGLQLAKALQRINGDESRVSFLTPDQNRPMLFSDPAHPAAQCRLDTLFNGARCPVAASAKLSETSYWPGTCDRPGEGPNTGSRPRCWFKP